jgi:subtilisin family serine protease
MSTTTKSLLIGLLGGTLITASAAVVAEEAVSQGEPQAPRAAAAHDRLDEGVQDVLAGSAAEAVIDDSATTDGGSGDATEKSALTTAGAAVAVTTDGEMTPMVGQPQRVSRTAAKPLATAQDGPPAVRPDAARAPSVGFSSGSFTPQAGADPDLLGKVRSGRRGRPIYAFLMLDEFLNEAIERNLRKLGVEVLGPHGDAYKIKLPANETVVREVEALPSVRWLGLSRREQRQSQELRQLGDRAAAPAGVAALPVTINLFEGDVREQMKRKLQAAGATVGAYDAELKAYRAVVSPEVLERIVDLEFVLFVEPVLTSGGGHDQSMATMGMDYIRPGGAGTRYNGASTTLGILDSGFMVGGAAPTTHQDLNKWGCGRNFTSETSVWDDQNGHGTHVLATIAGTGTANSRYRGAAIGIGSSGTNRLRAAKIWDRTNSGQMSWMENALDYMDDASDCSGESPRPQVINISGGGYWGSALSGTDSTSRKLDEKVWNYGQAYVVCVGNNGSGASTTWTPGVAKGALTVGNVLDNGYLSVGDVNGSSSRGPTADGRMKPNVVAPGTTVTSARAGTTNGYSDKVGCSMATPHVSGLAATLMEHYADFRWRPYLLRAHMMATAIPHDNVTTPANNSSGGRNDYGLGRVSAYVSHWARDNANGWTTHWSWGSVTPSTWRQRDIVVPAGTDRLVVVMTWDEPAASAGASNAVSYDIDLWVDRGADCTGSLGQCGEWASQSYIDNTEYVVINNPPAGTYRLKATPWNVPGSGLPVGIAATIVRGDPTPPMTLSAVPSTTLPRVGTSFTVTTTLTDPAYVASGVHLALSSMTPGVTIQDVRTIREDGIGMVFAGANNLTLGNTRQGDSRIATWTLRATSAGAKQLQFRAWSENGGTRLVTTQVTAQ